MGYSDEYSSEILGSDLCDRQARRRAQFNLLHWLLFVLIIALSIDFSMRFVAFKNGKRPSTPSSSPDSDPVYSQLLQLRKMQLENERKLMKDYSKRRDSMETHFKDLDLPPDEVPRRTIRLL